MLRHGRRLLSKQPTRTLPKVLVVAGPTGTGKSEVGLQLARKLDGEIVIADSVQIYKGTDIGSNKTKKCEIPQHLLDRFECDMDPPVTAAFFAQEAWKAIHDIIARNKIPIVVGGNGFYLQWLLFGNDGSGESVIRNRERCEELERRLRIRVGLRNSWSNVVFEAGNMVLESIDAQPFVDEHAIRSYLERIGEQDTRRLVRAIEILIGGNGKVPSYLSEKLKPGYDFRCNAISVDRLWLCRRLDFRCELMVQAGLIDEVKALIDAKKLPKSSPVRSAIGYKQTLEFIQEVEMTSSKSFDGAFRNFLYRLQASTRRFCKQQLDWFSARQEFRFVDMFLGKGHPGFNDMPRSLSFPRECVDPVVRDIQKHFEMSFEDYCRMVKSESYTEDQETIKAHIEMHGQDMNRYQPIPLIFRENMKSPLLLSLISQQISYKSP